MATLLRLEPGCNGLPITFTITINPAPPAITAGSLTGVISACEGSAAPNPNIQQFKLSGAHLTGNIKATAPAGFELSLSAGSGYGNTVTIPPSGSSVNSVTVYVRSSASAPAGNIAGNVVLTSPGAATQQVAVKGIVNALPTVDPVTNQIVTTGNATTAINFTGTANTFTWTNNNPGIGLPASGSGNIPAFAAINNGTTPVTASITVTPILAGFAYIGNNGEGTVSVISIATNTVVDKINVGQSPEGISLSPDGSKAYVSNNSSQNSVSVINTANNTVVATVGVGSYPSGIVVSPDGKKVYVANTLSNNVSVIDAASNTVTATIPVGAKPAGISVSPDGSKVYVANSYSNNIFVISTATDSVTGTIPVNSPFDVLISPDGNTLYVTCYSSSSVSVVNTANNTIVATIQVGLGPAGMAISHDGSSLYVTNFSSKNVSVINTATNSVTSTIGVGDSPAGISITPDDNWVYVANDISNNVSVINTATNTIAATINTGLGSAAYGNFITSGTGCSGAPVTFTITVKAAAVPAITAAGTLAALNTIYGTPSQSTSFAVSGANMKAGILVSPPPGFEVSTDNITYSPGLTVGAAGTISPALVYVRLASTTPVGIYSGDIDLSSAGATTVNVATAASTVSPAPLTIKAGNVTKTYGKVLSSGSGSTAFTPADLKNNETVGGITMTYGAGALGTDGAGTYTGAVVPSAAAGGSFLASNYTITYEPADITIEKATLTVTADNKTKAYGTPNPALTATYTGFVNNEGPLQLTTLPVLSTVASLTSLAGIYPITVTGGDSPNYNIVPASGVLTIISTINIPNTFTPNGDGINDLWNIQALSAYPQCIVSIFNRYGNLIFQSRGYPKSWDGTYKGATLPVGTYYYLINLQDGSEPLAGPVTIIR